MAIGVAVATLAACALQVISLWCPTTFRCSTPISEVSVTSGEFFVGFSLPPNRDGDAFSCSSTPTVGRVRMPRLLSIGRGSSFLGVSRGGARGFVLLPIAWTAAVGWIVVCVLRPGVADERRRMGLCPACGYDLRGSDSERCSECGMRRREEPNAVQLTGPARPVIVLITYVGVAALWACCMDTVITGRAMQFPDMSWHAVVLTKALGPLSMPFMLFPAWLQAGWVGWTVMGVLALALWILWLFALRHWRLARWRLSIHALLALSWFGGGYVVVGVLMSLFL